MKMHRSWIAGMTLGTLLSACAVGPDYVKPPVTLPTHYKEANRQWKIAEPADTIARGQWWVVFNDATLNQLEEQVNITNQSIAAAAAQYYQASAIVDEARASYFPTLAGAVGLMRQKTGSVSGRGGSANIANTNTNNTTTGSTTNATSGTTTTSTGTGTITTVSNPLTTHSLSLTAAWEPDIWGAVRRTVEADVANAQATAAALGVVQLSSQATLAQTYFQLRALDNDQKILDDTVREYKHILRYTQNRYASGVAGEADVIQAKTQVETAEASAINNKILRGQYEHAIAVLLGVPPANFSIVAKPCVQKPPRIPLEIPSRLLERRPDVAQSERLMAQANAQIGIAVSAYYPVLNLTGSASVTNPGFAHWFSLPALSWAIGAQISDTIFDGGLRNATVVAARANWDATVGNYRQTVLTALQNVEDSLVSLRLLNQEAVVQNHAATDAYHALQIVLNEYRAGTVDYNALLVAQNTAITADKTAADIHGQQMTSAVSLIKALGGSWEVSDLPVS